MSTWRSACPDRRHTPLRYHARLLSTLTGAGFRRVLAYRVDFLFGTAGFLVRIGTHVLLLVVIFDQVDALGGWTAEECLLLLGMAMVARGLDHCCTDQLWELSASLVRSGEFVRYLLRPVSPLLGLLSERFVHPDGLGELLAGTSLCGYAVYRLHGVGVPVGGGARWAGAVLLIGCGAVIYGSIKLLLASVAFWTVTSAHLMSSTLEVSVAANYPVTIFPTPVGVFLVGVLPFAFTGFVPADYFLHGLSTYTLAAPFVTTAVAVLAVTIWRRGLARFESVGL